MVTLDEKTGEILSTHLQTFSGSKVVTVEVDVQHLYPNGDK